MKQLYIFLILFASMNLMADGSQKVEHLTLDDFSVIYEGEILTLNQDFHVIQNRINKPSKVVRENSDISTNRDLIIHNYDGLLIEYLSGWMKVRKITFKDNKVCTNRGVTIGDDLGRIFEVYNMNDFQELPDRIFGYITVEDDIGIPSQYYIRFFIESSIISSIEMGIRAEL